MSTNLGSAYGEIILDASGATKGVKEAEEAIGGLETGFLKINPVIGATVVALGGLVAVGGGMVGIIGSSVSLAADLEVQLDAVQASSGATAEEMALLKDEITNLGLDPNLKVSATEAADSIDNLIRNGLTVQEVLDGAARSTVLLSNATGAKFTTAADIATDTMALFNIEAKDMEQAVNGITGVVNASKFSIDDYGLALAQGGGVAATSGVSFSDFNTVIAGISPLFSSGSDAGTSFKTFIQRLIPQTEEAGDAMQALGLKFYDSEGKMKSMGEISTMLNEKLYREFEMTVQLGGATKEMAKDAEKASEAIPKLTTRLSEQDTQMGILQRELTATIEKYGEGSIQADKKRAAIQKLTNSIAANKQEMAEQQDALGVMADATVKTITSTEKLTDEQRNSTLSVIFGSDAIRAASGIASLGAVAYETAADAVKALGVSMEEANAFAEGGITAYEALSLQMGKVTAAENAATRVDNLAGSIEKLQGVIEAIKIGIGDKFIPVLKQGADDAAAFLSANADQIVAFFGGIARGLGGAITTVQGILPILLTLGQYLSIATRDGLTFNNFLFQLPEGLQPIAQLMAQVGITIRDQLGSVLPTLLTLGQYLLAVAADGVPLNSFLFQLPQSLQPFAQLIGSLITSAETQLPGLITTITGFLSNLVTTFNEGGLAGLADKFWGWITGSTGVEATSGEMVGRAIGAITRTLNENWPAISAALTLWSDKFWEWIGTVIANSGEKLTEVLTSIQTWASQPDTQKQLKALGEAMGLALFDGLILVLKNVDKGTEAVLALLGMLGAVTVGLGESFLTIGTSIAGGFISGIIQKITGTETSSELSTLLGQLWSDVVKAVISATIPGASLAFATEHFNKLKENLAAIDFTSLGTSIVEGIITGITGGAAATVEAVVGLLTDAYNASRNFLQARSPSRLYDQDVGATMPAGMTQGVLGGVSDVQGALQQALSIPNLPDLGGSVAAASSTAGGGGVYQTIEKIEIIIPGTGSPTDVAKAVNAELQKIVGRVRKPAYS